MSDDLNLKETVANSDGEFFVSTVHLSAPHGPERDQHYETLVDGPEGGQEVRRYETREAAVDGHKEICERLRDGDFSREEIHVSYTLHIPARQDNSESGDG